jgi:hypothetical protein
VPFGTFVCTGTWEDTNQSGDYDDGEENTISCTNGKT